MKKKLYHLFIYSLALVLALGSCADPEATAPSQDFTKTFAGLTLQAVTLDPPAPVTSTPGSLTESAKANGFIAALSGYNGKGAVPGPVLTAQSEMTGNLTEGEITTLNGTTASDLKAVVGGAAVPAHLQAVLDKMNTNPVLQAYFTGLILPTVGEAQTHTPSPLPEVDKGLGFTGSNSRCLQQAQKALDDATKKLDQERLNDHSTVEKAYSMELSTADTELKECYNSAMDKKSLSTKKYDDLLITADKNKKPLGTAYVPVRALVNALYLDYLSKSNSLATANGVACAQKADVAKANAEVAKQINTAKVEAAYAQGILQAREIVRQLYDSCHNQGGGN